MEIGFGWSIVVGMGVLFFAIVFFNEFRDAIRGIDNRTEHEKLMDTRVTSSGVRVGAVYDALNATARGNKPTYWR